MKKMEEKNKPFLLQCSHRIWLTVPQYWSFKTNVEMNKEQSNSWEQKNQEGNRSKTPPPLPLNQHQLNDIRRVLPSFVAYRLPSFGLKKKRSRQEKEEEEKDEEKEKQGEKGNSNVCVCERERDRFAASAIAGRVSLFFWRRPASRRPTGPTLSAGHCHADCLDSPWWIRDSLFFFLFSWKKNTFNSIGFFSNCVFFFCIHVRLASVPQPLRKKCYRVLLAFY